MLTPSLLVHFFGTVIPRVRFFRRRWSEGRRKRVEAMYSLVGLKAGISERSPGFFHSLVEVVHLGDGEVQYLLVPVLV